MRCTRLSDRCLGSATGMTLLEVVVAGAILSVALLAAHHSATLAWALHRRGSSSSDNTIELWNRTCRFRARPEQEGTLFILDPDLRPLRQLVLEKNGLEWEVLRAR